MKGLPRKYIIAEMACSHEGDPSLAREIIHGAGKAGADAIQFQIYSQTERAVPQHPDYELLGKLELSHVDWAILVDYVRENYPQLEIIACVYERGSVDFTLSIGVDAFKIHSSDLSNPTFIQHVARTGKRVDLSVGASTLDEITRAIAWIKGTGNGQIWLMYGMQNFPTPPEEIHLGFMMKLQELFELPVGYQDHSDADTEAAFWLPAAAVGMGVSVLEKHITHDRSLRGVDHESALNPGEFECFVRMVRQIEAAIGITTPKPFTVEEMKYRRYAKKSIVAGREIPVGTHLRESDFKFMFAEKLGFAPDQVSTLIDKTAIHDIPAYQVLMEEDVL